MSNLDDIVNGVFEEAEEETEKTASQDKEEFANQVLARAKEKLANQEQEQEQDTDITEGQKEKVASISDQFGSEPKAELFEKVANMALLKDPKVIVDQKFQKYEDFDGNENNPELFNTPGAEKENQFPGGE